MFLLEMFFLTKLAEIACETKIVDFLSSGTRHGIMELIIETKQKMQEMATSAALNSDLLQTSKLPCAAYVLFFFRKDVSYFETLSVKVENVRNLCKTM